MERVAYYETKLGTLLVGCDGDAVTQLCWVDEPALPGDPTPLSDRAAEQVRRYLGGERRAFDLPLAPRGTDFQHAVWQALRRVPYGATTTYGEIAAALGRPAAARAVGAAVGRNPIWLAIPCHRCVGRDGSLTGYAGGLERKAFLLALEQDRNAP